MSDNNPITGYAVEPKTDCPHIPEYIIDTVDYLRVPCESCQDTVENWHCLHCKAVYCSRYRQGHMKQHIKESKHCVCISFSDLSAWCFECDNYVIHKNLEPLKYKLYVSKFGQEPPNMNHGSSSSSS